MSDNPGPGHEISEEAIYRVLQLTSEPAMSVSELADELDVTAQTIYPYLDELIERENVFKKQLGNATVYYVGHSHKIKQTGELLKQHQSILTETTFEPYTEDIGYDEEIREQLRNARATFLDIHGQFEKAIRNGHARRIIRDHYLVAIRDYLDQMPIRQAFDLNKYVKNENHTRIENKTDPFAPAGSDIDKDEMNHYLHEIKMFESDWFGEVAGVGGLLAFIFEYIDRRGDAIGTYEQNMEKYDSPDEVMRNRSLMLPDNDLLVAGQRLDTIIADVFRLNW